MIRTSSFILACLLLFSTISVSAAHRDTFSDYRSEHAWVAQRAECDGGITKIAAYLMSTNSFYTFEETTLSSGDIVYIFVSSKDENHFFVKPARSGEEPKEVSQEMWVKKIKLEAPDYYDAYINFVRGETKPNNCMIVEKK